MFSSENKKQLTGCDGCLCLMGMKNKNFESHSLLANENFSLNCAWNNNNDYMQDINRLKLVLVEKKRTNKWLSEQLGLNPSTVSKWCTNSSQPDLETLIKIASLLDVNVQDLLNTQKL